MSDPSEPQSSRATPTFTPEARCDECGVFGAHRIGETHLCTDCYAGKGSCCPEFGKDDLWEREEKPTRRPSA